MMPDQQLDRQAAQRLASEWLGRRKPAASASLKADEFAATVLAYEAALAATEQERDAQMGSKLEAQMVLKAITDCLCLDFSTLGNGWGEALPKVMARLETIMDEGERGFRERDEAERRVVRAEEQLAQIVVMAEAYRRYYIDEEIERGYAPYEASENADDFERDALAAASVADGGQAVEPAAEDETA